MKRLFALLLALAAGGCVNPTGSDDSGGNSSTSPTPMLATAPPPIDASEQVTGSADPLNFAQMPPCSSPTAQCFRYPFEINATTMVSAQLTWTVPASDFDLYVFQDNAQVDGGGGASPPGPPTGGEAIEEEFEAGAYELVVVAWSVAQDTFTLHAEFMTTGAAGNATNTTMFR